MKNSKHPFLVKNNQFATSKMKIFLSYLPNYSVTNIMKCDVQKSKGLIGDIIAMCLKGSFIFMTSLNIIIKKSIL